ncbi:MAG: transposase [Paracoccaceae bacterium]|jgi:hypothetical protein
MGRRLQRNLPRGGRIAQLYAIDKEARGSPPDRRVETRQAKAKPIFDGLEVWLHAQLPSISGKSPLAAAIRYALARMARMRPYLGHAIPELDNNTAERALRSVAPSRQIALQSPAHCLTGHSQCPRRGQ